MRTRTCLVLALAACAPGSGGDDLDTSDSDTAGPGDPFAGFPAPDAWGATSGPGAPARSFEASELFEACAWLQGDADRESDHHNLVVMYDGYLVMPWAPEWGPQRKALTEDCGFDPLPTPESPGEVGTCPGRFGGGLTFWDVSDPCTPVKVGEGWTPWMRESHAIGFGVVDGRTYAAVDFLALDGSGGVGFWDITDVTAPTFVSWVRLPGHQYPDSYLRLTLSVFWQGRYVYASTAGHGVFVVDAADPLRPEVVDTVPDDDTKWAFKFEGEGIHHGGTFHVFGNRAMASAAGIASTFLVDLSDPVHAEVEVGGSFSPQSDEGDPLQYYFANVGSHYGLFARNQAGGGPLVVDITDPSAPVTVAQLHQPTGDGGYIFQHGDRLFQGESSFGAVYRFDGSTLEEEGRFELRGDLDTVTPIGNVAFVAVDEGADEGRATSLVPWATEPDADPPRPGLTSPVDGATLQAVTSRVGVIFDEMIEPVSVFAGSFRVATASGRVVEGMYQVQENVVNFSPREPLEPGTTYRVQLPAGGLVDLSGNALGETLEWSFETAP